MTGAQAILKAIKQDCKTAEHYLLCYDDERKKYDLERADILKGCISMTLWDFLDTCQCTQVK